MAILIRQELYKIFKRKKTLVVIIAFILLTTVLTLGNKQSADYMKEYSTPEFQIENLQYNNEYLEMELKTRPDYLEDHEIERYHEDLRNEIERNNQEIERLKLSMSGDISWQEALGQNIQGLEELIEEESKHNLAGFDYLASLKMDLDVLKHLEENNIEPQESYEFNAFKNLGEIVEQLGQAFLVIGIAVFAADIVSGEWTPPTMKFLLVQPVSRGKVLLAKFIATLISALGLILIIEIVFTIVVGLAFGFGDMNYPVIVNKVFDFDYSIMFEDGSHPMILLDGSWDIIPAWQYSLKLLGYQGLFILATSSLVFMISSIAKSSMISMGVSVVSLIAGSIVFQISTFYGLSKYVFTSYSLTGALITGDIVRYYNDPNFTGSLGLIVMIGWIILTYIVSHILFKKRDMLV